jgi:hypothetical protein
MEYTGRSAGKLHLIADMRIIICKTRLEILVMIYLGKKHMVIEYCSAGTIVKEENCYL